MPNITYNGKLDKLVKSKKSLITIKKETKDSFDWFKDNIGTAFKKTINVKNKNWIVNKLEGHIPENVDPGIQIVSKPTIGHLYFYMYDPKWKDTLPYYDMFPLTMPIEPYDNGFLGLNFHYLPINLRAKLLDLLLKYIDEKNDEEYIKISYDILKGMKTSTYKPTIKRYLWSQFRSPFAEINSKVWDRIIFLPVENFKKKSKEEVWKESKSKI